MASRTRKGLGYVRRMKQALLPARDLERLRKRGWLVLDGDDYVETRVTAVYEVDQRNVSSRLIGLVTHEESMKYVVERADTKHVKSNRLIRLSDLMDIKRLAWRTGRAKSTVVGTWFKWEDWPASIAEFGGSSVWYWPDVLACLERHGVTVRRESANGESEQ